MDVLAFVRQIITLAGTKLPQIWPDVVEIFNRIETILAKLKGNMFGSGMQMVPSSDEGAKLVEELAKHGVDRDEAKKTIAIAEQASTL